MGSGASRQTNRESSVATRTGMSKDAHLRELLLQKSAEVQKLQGECDR